ncbi:antitoxin [Pseudonocardia abyssalis]|uniref:Antitoxin n=1 Tax=Pseudonocardia abyssalis TaxID=2792008 RepID=A0ABS6UUN3_9PSEU|nr:antitoxin [Pseudonocardia abyssalis]MBW0135979.1 antitoxin [Pseudonocardia abyssalis]
MSFLDKAKDLLNQHDDKVDQALDKAGEAAKGRFAGHEGHIDGLVDQAQQRTGAGDTTQQAPPAPAPADGAPADEQQLETPPPAPPQQ